MRQLQERFPYLTRELLGFQPRPDASTDALICHWHLQFHNPLYRDYTSLRLVRCWSGPTTSISIDETKK